ncbi:MAG: NUDIX domain-containing protein, partial [Proteobacteria bacterium]|nr:NUDIX domain-containing protein [Pseudomonadota bacterium]
QNQFGWIDSFLNGGVTTMISAGEVHVPGRPRDIVGLKAMAIFAQRSFQNLRPGGVKVHAGAPVIEKGMVEDDETPLEAAQRETLEEAGISELEFRWGDDFYETPPYNRGKVARYYLAHTLEEAISIVPNPVTGRLEHVEYRWVSFEQAWRMVSPRVQRVLSWAAIQLALDSEGHAANGEIAE